jgi:glycosyltransferase involved in cell wall biosynthesis
MYGSSKVLLSLVLQLKENSSQYNPIVCLPPEEGPLKDKLNQAAVQIIEMPVVKLTRSMLRSLNFIKLISEYYKAKRIFRKETKGLSVDYIQSNTLATMFGAWYCKFRKPKHIMHVHEIMDRPKIATRFFKGVLKYFCDEVVYNSVATASFYNHHSPALKKKSRTIVNGVDRTEATIPDSKRRQIRTELMNVDNDEVVIGLVGRINRLKGHELTLTAFKQLTEDYPRVKLCFIGSPPPGQEHFLTNLKELIEKAGLEDKVRIIGFQDEVFSILESLDIAVVPSTEPESFGLVVVEAMMAGKAVVGSDIGGISTIIRHNETGLLFEPNNEKEYVAALRELLDDPDLKAGMEEKASTYAMETYSSKAMYTKFTQLYDTLS